MERGWKAKADCVPPLFHTVSSTRLLATIALHPDRSLAALRRYRGERHMHLHTTLQHWVARGVLVKCSRTKTYRLEWRQRSSAALRRLLLALVACDSDLRRPFTEKPVPAKREWPPPVEPSSAPHDILGQPTRTAVLLLLAASRESQTLRLARLLCVKRWIVTSILDDFIEIGFISPRPRRSPKPLKFDGPSPLVPKFVGYLNSLNEQVGIYRDIAET
jgi:hypothetical protein